MRMPRLQFTVGRLMLESALAAGILASVGYARRHPVGEEETALTWAVVMGWVGLLLLIRWVYRDFRNPFG